jgi:hypothetical protein
MSLARRNAVDDNAVKLMLLDVSRDLIERTKAAREEFKRTKSERDMGRHLALYEVMSLLVHEAEAFGIDKAAIGLDGLNPDRDLL